MASSVPRKNLRLISLFCLLPVTLTSCATLLSRQAASDRVDITMTKEASQRDAVAKAIEEATPPPAADSDKGDRSDSADSDDEMDASEIENLTIDEVIRIEEPNTQNLYDNSRYDFPITMNSRVEGWIDYFTGRGREHMERYLARSSMYIPAMKQILKKAGMPEDLVYLALIESGFNLRAKSRARAVGPWQFMKQTAQRYGLRVDAWIDERRDPIRSTEAAAKYLKDLYLMFESWYLAASAYNAGEYKILRAIEQLKTNNYWRICQTRFLRRETKDYVPKLIAAAIIAKNPARYGFDDITYMDPFEYDTVQIDFPMQLKELAKLVDASEDDLEDLNPELRRAMVPPSGSYEVRIPVGSRVLAERAIAAIRTKLVESNLPAQYTVQSGDTLRNLARRFRVRPAELAEINNLGRRERLTPGLSLIIPKKGDTTRTVAKVHRAVSGGIGTRARSWEGFVTHIVRRGESLWSISEKYNVTVQDLFRWNNLRKSRLVPGKRLKIKARRPGDADDA